QPKPSNATTPCWNNPRWRHNLNQMASGKPGAVQLGKKLPLNYRLRVAIAAHQQQNPPNIGGSFPLV
ncbi:hypothetical protein, partial [Bradyrhizobium sp. 44]|uniref:hypothetical protein n=1 Tax=Bradyrhizobium sp. 44 TaxID=2782675 RepID=UPI001FFC12A6